MKEPLKILIIDDNPDDRVLASRELKREFQDIEIQEVINEDEFTDVMEEGDFDVVITDYQIRWTTGLDVLDEVKDRYPNCPVIMFTGTGGEDIAVQAMKAGLDDYVVKSVKHFVRLPAAVRSVVEKKEEQRARKRAEYLYKRLFEGIPIGMYSVTPEGEMQAVNKALLDLLEYPDMETLMNTDVQDLYVDPGEREKHINKVKEEGILEDVELKLRTYHDEIIWVVDNAHAVFDEEGRVELIEGSLKDITERKEAKRALRENKEKIEGLHETSLAVQRCDSEEEMYETILDAAENILDFHVCSIFIEKKGSLLVKATTDERLPEGDELSISNGIYGKTYRNQESYLVGDINESNQAKPTASEYKSVVSVPITDMGVFQVISDEVDYFDESDLNLTEILVSHLVEGLKSIRHEEELRQSEEKYRRLVELSPDAIAVHSDGELRFINSAGAEILGVDDPEEIIGTSIMKGVHPEYRDIVEERIKKMVDERETIQLMEEKFIRQDTGEPIDVEVTAAPIPYEDETAILVIFRDISERKEMEEKLKESEKRYRTIFQHSGTAIAIIEEDTRVSMINKEMEKYCGYSKEEIEGKKKWSDFIVEEDVERMLEYHEKRREDPDSAPTRYTFKFINRFGDTRDMLVNVSLIPGTSRTIASMIDITQDIRTKEALEESQEMFRTAFDNSPIGMSLLDLDGNFLQLNNTFCDLLGYTEDELMSMNFSDMLKEDHRERWSDKLEKLESEEMERFTETMVLNGKEGKKMEFDIYVSVITDRDDEPAYILNQIQKNRD